MPSHEHRRSHRQAPVTRRPEEVALARAIMLARTLKWREEWRAEVAGRAAREIGKANGPAAKAAMLEPRRRPDGTAARFAGAVARNEFGRFYCSSTEEDALIAARKRKKPKQKPRKSE